tara:strand:+ start:6545 stop:6949 length:405 start_codon:yes stop_codon:yes gene_type:complete
MKTQDEKTLEAMAGIGADIQLPSPCIANKDGTIAQQKTVMGDLEFLYQELQKYTGEDWATASKVEQAYQNIRADLNTNERVKELEAQLKVAKEGLEDVVKNLYATQYADVLKNQVNIARYKAKKALQQINGGRE